MLEDREFIELGIMNETVRGFRKIVRTNELTGTGDEKVLVGTIYNKEGKELDRFTLVNDLLNIASFICLNKEDKLITNSSGGIVLNTLGNYIDLCADKEFQDDLLPVLTRIQRNPRKRTELRTVPTNTERGD